MIDEYTVRHYAVMAWHDYAAAQREIYFEFRLLRLEGALCYAWLAADTARSLWKEDEKYKPLYDRASQLYSFLSKGKSIPAGSADYEKATGT